LVIGAQTLPIRIVSRSVGKPETGKVIGQPPLKRDQPFGRLPVLRQAMLPFRSAPRIGLASDHVAPDLLKNP
jgi:hypothetical protein